MWFIRPFKRLIHCSTNTFCDLYYGFEFEPYTILLCGHTRTHQDNKQTLLCDDREIVDQLFSINWTLSRGTTRMNCGQALMKVNEGGFYVGVDPRHLILTEAAYRFPQLYWNHFRPKLINNTILAVCLKVWMDTLYSMN